MNGNRISWEFMKGISSINVLPTCSVSNNKPGCKKFDFYGREKWHFITLSQLQQNQEKQNDRREKRAINLLLRGRERKEMTTFGHQRLFLVPFLHSANISTSNQNRNGDHPLFSLGCLPFFHHSSTASSVFGKKFSIFQQNIIFQTAYEIVSLA